MGRSGMIGASLRAVALVSAAALLAGCATTAAFRDGERAAQVEDWDSAVEYYRQAVQDDPQNAEYRVALHRAMINAAREHYARAEALEETGALVEAVRAYRRAGELDPRQQRRVVPGGRAGAGPSATASRPPARVRRSRTCATSPAARRTRRCWSRRPASRSACASSTRACRTSSTSSAMRPASTSTSTSSSRIARYSVQLDGVTVEEALDQILMANQYFFLQGPRPAQRDRRTRHTAEALAVRGPGDPHVLRVAHGRDGAGDPAAADHPRRRRRPRCSRRSCRTACPTRSPCGPRRPLPPSSSA